MHARGQVCHVDLPAAAWTALASQRNPAETALVRRLAGMLPPDVRVRRARVARVGFDARFSAVSRRYAYRLVDDPAHADPLHRHFVVVHRHPVDVDAMAAAAQPLVGEHDFVAFCRRREGATTVRRILRLDCERRADGVVTVDVAADAFCHQMVRSVVGALVTVGEGRRDVSWPQSLLSATQRESAVPVMPAHGLTLEEVRYPPDDQLAARAAETRSVRRLGADVESSAHWEG